MSAATVVEVTCADGRHRLRHREGLIRAQQLHGPPEVCRVALLATTGLLLGGDEVVIEIVVGPGSRLELSDVAGTVAYHGRGRAARWSVAITLAAGSRLTYWGEPFVVSEGADVTRDLDLDLDPQGELLLRDTVVLGRSGERSGRLRAGTRVRRGDLPVLLEDLQLDADSAPLPGLLGGHRVIDTLLGVGLAEPPQLDGAETFTLVDPAATLTRYLGSTLDASPLHAFRSRSPKCFPQPEYGLREAL